MKATKLLIAATLIVFTAATPSFAQRSRGGGGGGGGGARAAGRTATPVPGRAVPRGSVHPGYPPGGRYPGGGYYRGPYYRPYYGYPYYGYPYYGGYYGYGPTFGFGFSFGYPGYYGYYGYGYPYYGGYPYYYGPGYPGYVAVVPGRPYGAVRLDLPERDAQVFVDGAYAGVVDNYDGSLQSLNLEPGTHQIEIRLDGFQSTSFNVSVAPGRTVTYRTPLRPAP
jgi:hypothetical protein